jgi:osmotically-inducible protein OsmY
MKVSEMEGGNMFTKTKLLRSASVGVLACGLFTLASPVIAAQDKPKPADNTSRNRSTGPTADQQKNNKTDLQLAKDIRKAIVDDKSLSTYAHNVKIVAKNGAVTLRGPVRSDEEKATIEAKAAQVAGAGNVTNRLTVAPKK